MCEQKQPPTDTTADKKKYEEEFDEYSQKLQKAKEDYRKEHPDMRTPEIIDDAKNVSVAFLKTVVRFLILAFISSLAHVLRLVFISV